MERTEVEQGGQRSVGGTAPAERGASRRLYVFIKTIRPEDIAAYLNGLAQFDGREGRAFSKHLPHAVREVVVSVFNAPAPNHPDDRASWLNVAGFCNLINELNSPELWHHLLANSSDDIRKSVLQETRTQNLAQASHLLSIINESFMSFSLIVGLLSAASGKGVVASVLDSPQPPLPNLWKDRLRNVAAEISNRYAAAANGPKELLTRMRQLIPGSNRADQDGGALFDLLVTHELFENERNNHKCPAVALTYLILSAYGDLLANATYQMRFEKAVCL